MNKSSLGVVSSFGQALISFFVAFIRAMTVVEKAVSMADESITLAAEKQAVDLELERISYASTKINEATLKHAKQEEDMVQFASGNEDRKKLVDATKAMLTERVNRRMAALHQVAS